KLKALEIERSSLTEKLRLIDAEANVVKLHPKAIDQFVAKMQEVHEALTGNLDTIQRAPFRAVFRNVFEHIVVWPTVQTGRRNRYAFEPYLRLAAVLDINFPKPRSTQEMLAEQGASEDTILAASRR